MEQNFNLYSGKDSVSQLDLSTIFKIPQLKKEYNVTHDKDKDHIDNGRCPDYALYWPEEKNKIYWPQGHNFYTGNQQNIDESSYYNIWRKIAEKKALIPQIFCSLNILVCNIDDPHTNLNLSKYGKQLWDVIKQLNPIIIIDELNFTEEKKKWCNSKLNTANIAAASSTIQDALAADNYSLILIDYKDSYMINRPPNQEPNQEPNNKKIFIQYTNIIENLIRLLENI